MKIILKQDIHGLGKKDDIVNASDGYAKNYLIPRGMAIEATAGNVNEAKNKQKAAADKKQRSRPRPERAESCSAPFRPRILPTP